MGRDICWKAIAYRMVDRVFETALFGGALLAESVRSPPSNGAPMETVFSHLLDSDCGVGGSAASRIFQRSVHICT